ncbi:uncharacterized protein BDV17DRAFT_266119 [Aspergillus undulatus]|uniref:uncharacterized protein n=1 Tax=Aspergillus undulatus TaxID=1810928 RepID=UPI003CCDF8EB
MLLQFFSLAAIYLAAMSNAAVTFYGSNNGGYVSCEFPYARVDNAAPFYISLVYPGLDMAGQAALHFETEEITCGNELDRSLQFECQVHHANSTCIPSDTINSSPNSNSNSHPASVPRRSLLTPLVKQASAECDRYTGSCRNQYQSSTGDCASNYTTKYITAGDNAPEMWCTKPCTEEEQQSCRKNSCDDWRPQCEGQSTNRALCVNSLLFCKGTPVSMQERWCAADPFTAVGKGLGAYCERQGKECYKYSEGACTLSREYVEEYQQVITDSVLGGV